MQKDNSTLTKKVTLRLNLLKEFPEPVVLETHGGEGRIWWRCYSKVVQGVVMETKPEKCNILARQRPTWSVYECDCVTALRAGVGSHLPINFVDLDPYGEPWPVLDALFESDRPWPAKMGIVVNDGLRRNMRFGLGWQTDSMSGPAKRYGTQALFHNYLQICQELLSEKAAQRGYRLTRWAGYYCGEKEQITHYAAVLEH